MTDTLGDPRRCGVEIEFSGLTAEKVADIATRILRGTADQTDDHAFTITGSEIGGIEVYLDTALRHADSSAVKAIGLDLGQAVIPVELVTEPLTLDQMAPLDRLRSALREAGAEGSRAGLAYGFGVHFNPSLAARDTKSITHPLLAYALIEDWMRSAHPIDFSRKVLPFTDPYPTDLVRAFCDQGFVTPEVATDLYLRHASGRNYGLDMLPIFAWMDEEDGTTKVADALGDDSTSARPAFHFRLPDCRIDEADWSLRGEWLRWLLVEEIAADEALLVKLLHGWEDAHGRVTLSRAPWARRCGEILKDAGVPARTIARDKTEDQENDEGEAA